MERLRACHPGLPEARRAALRLGRPNPPAHIGRKFMVRLVKGAYWDTEIKAAQVAGLDDYPVFTRKVATDVSYIACAKRLLARRRDLPRLRHAQCQYHRSDQGAGREGEFEFQRLHGMGEGLYEELAELRRALARRGRRCAFTRRSGAIRTCSPIWSAGCWRTAPTGSFVNRIADEQVSLDELVGTRSPNLRRSNRSAIRGSFFRRALRSAAAQQRRCRLSATRWSASHC